MRCVVLPFSVFLALPGQLIIPQAQVYLTSENRRELKQRRKKYPTRTLWPRLFGAEYHVATRRQLRPVKFCCNYSAPNNARAGVWCPPIIPRGIMGSCWFCAYTSAVAAFLVGLSADELPSAPELGYCVRQDGNKKSSPRQSKGCRRQQASFHEPAHAVECVRIPALLQARGRAGRLGPHKTTDVCRRAVSVVAKVADAPACATSDASGASQLTRVLVRWSIRP